MVRYNCIPGIVHRLLISAEGYQKHTVRLTTLWTRAEFITQEAVAYASTLRSSNEAMFPWMVTRRGLKTLVVGVLSVDIRGCEV